MHEVLQYWTIARVHPQDACAAENESPQGGYRSTNDGALTMTHSTNRPKPGEIIFVCLKCQAAYSVQTRSNECPVCGWDMRRRGVDGEEVREGKP